MSTELNRLLGYLFGSRDRCPIDEIILGVITEGLYHVFNANLHDVAHGSMYLESLENGLLSELLDTIENFRG